MEALDPRNYNYVHTVLKREYCSENGKLYDWAEQEFPLIGMMDMVEHVDDRAIFEIEKLRVNGQLSEKTKRQMLALAYCTWLLVLSEGIIQERVLRIDSIGGSSPEKPPMAGTYIQCTDILRRFSSAAFFELLHHDSRRTSLALRAIGEYILDHISMTDHPDGALAGDLHDPLAGVRMDIVPISYVSNYQNGKRHEMGFDDPLNNFFHQLKLRDLRYPKILPCFSSWRSPLEGCQDCVEDNGDSLEGAFSYLRKGDRGDHEQPWLEHYNAVHRDAKKKNTPGK